MKLDSLKALYIHELNDLHDAEKQLVKVLPKLAKAASSEDLRLAFNRHSDQTKKHVERLDRVFSSLKEKPKRVTCKAMKGIVEEVEEMILAEGDPAIKDAGLISAAQRGEHYEMAGYGCARTYAEWLGEKDSAELLQKTLNDERATDESLTDLAERLIHTKPVHV
jgi:ferritin-like metal-binding protein YciE